MYEHHQMNSFMVNIDSFNEDGEQNRIRINKTAIHYSSSNKQHPQFIQNSKLLMLLLVVLQHAFAFTLALNLVLST